MTDLPRYDLGLGTIVINGTCVEVYDSRSPDVLDYKVWVNEVGGLALRAFGNEINDVLYNAEVGSLLLIKMIGFGTVDELIERIRPNIVTSKDLRVAAANVAVAISRYKDYLNCNLYKVLRDAGYSKLLWDIVKRPFTRSAEDFHLDEDFTVPMALATLYQFCSFNSNDANCGYPSRNDGGIVQYLVREFDGDRPYLEEVITAATNSGLLEYLLSSHRPYDIRDLKWLSKMDVMAVALDSALLPSMINHYLNDLHFNTLYHVHYDAGECHETVKFLLSFGFDPKVVSDHVNFHRRKYRLEQLDPIVPGPLAEERKARMAKEFSHYLTH